MKALIFSGCDGHGLSCAVQSALNLEKEGYYTDIFCRFPDTGKPEIFWEKTFDTIHNLNYDFILILDIPFIKGKVNECLRKLEIVSKRIKLLYIDHHKSSKIESQSDFVKIVDDTIYCCYGETSEIMRIGGICDRDQNILPVTLDELFIAGGLDISVRENSVEAIAKLKMKDYNYFRNMSCAIPDVEILKIFHPFLLLASIKAGNKSWKFKSLEKSIQQKGLIYGIGLMDEPGETELIIIKDWLRTDFPDVENCLVSSGITGKNNSSEYRNYYGHENAIVFRYGSNKPSLERFIQIFTKGDYIL